MEFFLDTADIKEIETGLEWGLVDGITTNPSLIAKQGKNYLATVQEIARLVPGPVSGEVLATEFDGMIRKAASTTDPKESIRLFRKAEMRAVEGMCKMPLYFYTKSTLLKPWASILTR